MSVFLQVCLDIAQKWSIQRDPHRNVGVDGVAQSNTYDFAHRSGFPEYYTFNSTTAATTTINSTTASNVAYTTTCAI